MSGAVTYRVGLVEYSKLDDVPPEATRVFRVTHGAGSRVKHVELLVCGKHWRRVQPSMMLAPSAPFRKLVRR